MRILVLAPYPPYPPHGGGSMRIYQLLRGLAARHDVICLTFAPDEAAEQALEPLRAICRVLTVRGPEQRSTVRRALTTLITPLPDMALRNASAAYTAALRALLANAPFDVIQAESIEMAGYLEVVNIQVSTENSKLKTQNSKLILDQFNAEFLLQQRAFLTDARRPRRWHAAAYSLVQWRKLAAYERRVMQRCDAVVAVSEDDARTLKALQRRGQGAGGRGQGEDHNARIGVVPNGVDTTAFSRAALASERAGALSFDAPAIVFSGTLDFRPNVDALAWFVRAVLPHIRARCSAARCVVVGKRPGALLHQLAREGAITLVGAVPDARPYIAAASVYVVPMRIGGGVRLKLLEAFALEAPVVSTTMGAEGVVGLRAGEHCLLADDPPQFAAAVLRLLDDRALAQRLGAAARALVQQHYDWATIVPKLEAIYTGIGGGDW